MSLSDPNRGRLATSTGDMLWYSGRDLVPWYGVLVEEGGIEGVEAAAAAAGSIDKSPCPERGQTLLSK